MFIYRVGRFIGLTQERLDKAMFRFNAAARWVRSSV